MSSASNTYRRGFCPSAGKPMQSGDGLLSRVQLLGGRLQVKDLQRLAEWAETLAQPIIEITSRGKLQLRGFSEISEAQFTQQLQQQGLASATPAAEAARKVLCSPLADLDPLAITDPYPIAKQLENRIVNQASLWQLPSKFLLVLDGGGVSSLSQLKADICCRAIDTSQGLHFEILLATATPKAINLGLCAARECSEAVEGLLRCFIALNKQQGNHAQRLKDVLIDAQSTEAFKASLLSTTIKAQQADNINEQEISPPAITQNPHNAVLGKHKNWFACAPTFGVLSSDSAKAIVALALANNITELRITPNKQLVFPNGSAALGPTLKQLDMIITAEDPRLSLHACPGSPSCLSGSSDTRGDALRWAKACPELFSTTANIHISGCGKGCAHPRPSPLTLTARQGRYDIIINDCADPIDDDHCLAKNIAPEEVPAILNRLTLSS